MTTPGKNPENRYVNDLRRLQYSQSQYYNMRGIVVALGLSVLFLAIVGLLVGRSYSGFGNETVIVVIAAVVGGYMALNIGANDVANNMGPAVGGGVLTVFWAVIIAAVCETAGALLAGGDVVSTVSKGIVTHASDDISIEEFRSLMLAALFAAGLWINMATWMGAPVSTTHSIVGGVMGAGIAAAGFGLVDWQTMGMIAASWVISPVFGACVAAVLLYLIKIKVLNVEDRIPAAKKWLPVLIAVMAAAFAAYMATKGLRNIWPASPLEIILVSLATLIAAYFLARPHINKKIIGRQNTKKEMYGLFDVPLIIGVALLSFAHGANDVANAVGPLAAIVSTLSDSNPISSQVEIPLWVMVVGAFGIAFGLALFGPKLIGVVGKKITRLNSPRAYCVALSSAVTVLIASSMGLPVSSTHIAIGAVFGVGFLREYTENPNKRKLRPGHKLNATADDAFDAIAASGKRRLVRRNFVLSIAAAWVVTVPASALLAAMLYWLLRFL